MEISKKWKKCREIRIKNFSIKLMHALFSIKLMCIFKIECKYFPKDFQ